ncbi:MAG TPA: CDP-alcohol phosphatidyltransferase family protein [Frankiaceae bacterium]|jgi:CDP-diacylglycerol--glycerol-3-phosphate 3-phosphatidyltransferase|nr:CDP-alcohol phosphatidyltransferase family protein [Frankiaceae bacterium]
MLASQARPQIQRILDPLGRRLAQTGLSPDVVTVVGTLGVSGAAIGFFSRGVFFWGTLAITLFVFSDLLDGLIARAKGTSSKWGAFLDSSSDRVADSAIFGSLAMWYAGDGKSLPLAGAAIFALAAGGIISYVKARAESLGFDCNTGFAERGERLLIVLVAAAITGLGVPWLLPAALWFLCAATTITVGQRLRYVYKQAREADPRPERPARRPGRRVIARSRRHDAEHAAVR